MKSVLGDVSRLTNVINSKLDPIPSNSDKLLGIGSIPSNSDKLWPSFTLAIS